MLSQFATVVQDHLWKNSRAWQQLTQRYQRDRY